MDGRIVAIGSLEDVLAATVGNSSKAVPGSYDVSVQQLAQGQVLNSEAVKTATTAIGTGVDAARRAWPTAPFTSTFPTRMNWWKRLLQIK